MKKLSILIPSYFRKEKLNRVIESALNINECNIVVCFDSFDDPNIELINKKYPNVIIYTKQNGGVADTRNFLLDKCDSEYFLFVDDDDMVHPDFVKWWNDNYNSINKDVYRMEFDKYKNDVIFRKIRYNFSGKYLRKVDSFNTNHVSSYLIKKSFIDKYKIRFNVGHIGEDHSYSAMILANSKRIINSKVKSIMYDGTGEDKLTKDFSDKQLDKNLMEVDYLISNWKSNRYFLPKALDLVWGLSKQPDKWPKNTPDKLKPRLKLIRKHKMRIIINAPLWHKFAYLKFMLLPGF